MFVWVEAGPGQDWVQWDGDRGLREAQPPLDKLELQTCEIRMEPCLLRCDLKDRARSGSPFTVRLPRQTPDAAPLCCFDLLFFGQI